MNKLCINRSSHHNKFSIIPKDKNFSISLYLRLIHAEITFLDLINGLNNLIEKLTLHSNQRINLVRSHFGLFIKCAEGTYVCLLLCDLISFRFDSLGLSDFNE